MSIIQGKQFDNKILIKALWSTVLKIKPLSGLALNVYFQLSTDYTLNYTEQHFHAKLQFSSVLQFYLKTLKIFLPKSALLPLSGLLNKNPFKSKAHFCTHSTYPSQSYSSTLKVHFYSKLTLPP